VRIVLWIGAALAVVLVLAVFGLYRASRHVPEFYAQALLGDPVAQKAASQEMQLRSVELASHVQRGGRWQQTFTAEQINGWLAVGMFEKHEEDGAERFAAAIPPFIKDPRVAITPEGLSLACRYQGGSWGDTVLSLTVDAYATEENEIGLRIRRLRAGAVPVPVGTVLKELSPAWRQMPWRTRLSEQQGEPVVLISIPPQGKRGELLVRVEAIRFGDGKIEVAGTTQRR